MLCWAPDGRSVVDWPTGAGLVPEKPDAAIAETARRGWEIRRQRVALDGNHGEAHGVSCPPGAASNPTDHCAAPGH